MHTFVLRIYDFYVLAVSATYCPGWAKAQVELCHSLHLLKVCILGVNFKTRFFIMY